MQTAPITDAADQVTPLKPVTDHANSYLMKVRPEQLFAQRWLDHPLLQPPQGICQIEVHHPQSYLWFKNHSLSVIVEPSLPGHNLALGIEGPTCFSRSE